MIVQFRNVGATGLNADLPAHDLAEQPIAWSSARNITFRAQLAQRVQGYAAEFDATPTQSPLGMFAATKNDGTHYLVVGGTTKVFDYTNITENEITGTTVPAATADTKWSGGILTGYLILNETTKAPQYIAIEQLGGATNLADLTNWPASTTCGVIRPFKYFLVAGDMTESSTRYPYKVRWSTAAVPGTLPASWTASASNDAGSVDLSGDYGKVIDMVPFGDQMAIYRERGITMMRYVGGTDSANRLVMAFNDVPAGQSLGMLGLNCGVDVVGIGHVVLSAADVYVFDGTRVTSVLDKRMRNWLRTTMDLTYAKRSFVVNHADQSEVWICFPESGSTSCTKAIIFNYGDNTLGVRDLPNATCGLHAVVRENNGTTWANLSGTWADQTQTWAQLEGTQPFRKTVIGSANTKIYVIGNGIDENGTAMIAQLERTGMSLGDPQRVKYFRTVWPRFDAPQGTQIEINVGTQMAIDESVSWQPAVTYTVGTSRKVDVNKSGRFLALRFRTTIGGVWRLNQFEVDMQPQGLW